MSNILMKEPHIRAMRREDLPDLVSVHLKSFPGFFLTMLGPKFLSILYSGISCDISGVVIVSEENGEISGFAAGVIDSGGFYRRLISKRWLQLCLACLGTLIRKPKIAGRLFRTAKKPSLLGKMSASACLMSIAVAPRCAGKGIGRELVKAFSRELEMRGCKAYCLTTDSENNDGINEFYCKLGFRRVRIFSTPEGRRMNEYLKILD